MLMIVNYSWCLEPPFETEQAISSVEACIVDIISWRQRNFLKLNNDKTEIIVFGNICCKQKLASSSQIKLKIGEKTITPNSK